MSGSVADPATMAPAARASSTEVLLDLGSRFGVNAPMESIDTELVARIRQDIILGSYSEGERLSEAQLCETHNVSRTPIRLALRLLEREGVIRRGEGRGYMVQSPTVEDILQAVEVRGHLESLAARLMAQEPSRFDQLPTMRRAMEQIDASVSELSRLGQLNDFVTRQAQAANKEFHAAILTSCGNEYVSYACKQISHLPMLAVGSMVFDRSVDKTPDQFERGLFRLRLGNAQHQVICDAIESGDPVRAEGMMREHSHTMIEYIQTFEKRGKSLTVADLVAFSAADPPPPAA
ncbi:MAG: GntR family transcriptional regulator [Boseongicola sp. SB0664_bin_43]|uniref:GntR family transcriptional regulator n=1 Tax=Boseongicola sp. SB0664_bin_43 TaxID=2604844 RepID=A0A6B0Y0F6_9RHOB|nr:GntR family transcriptional regulator [Boseongicola sp. SB0664_bin_43]